MVPPAPPRFSITIGWPRAALIFSATTRAIRALAPPRGVGPEEGDRGRRKIGGERRSRERDSEAGAEKHPDESVDRHGGLPHGSGRALPGDGAAKAVSMLATRVQNRARP